ncbi:MAG: hypothetical protein GX596_03690, partial [Propionibacterium sp.]|nr:hypothetical protein [Propionibacterium sp.]
MTVPAEIELEATTDESLYNTGYSVVIINEDAAPGTHMAACGSGTTCGASDWVTWAENPNPQPRHFRAELRHAGAVVASDQVVVDVVAAEWTVSLEANATSVTVPSEIQLEATANRSMSGTGYSIKVVDVDDARDMNGWCSGATCGASEWVTWAENHDPQPHHYRAEVRHSATGTVVASDTITVDVVPADWSVSLDANAEEVTIPAEIEVEATANRAMSGTGYSIKIVDVDDVRDMNGWCSGATCGASEWMTWADNPSPEQQTYRAEVRHSSTGTVVASDTVTVDVLPFTFGASLGFSVENGVNKATATATPSPNGTPYSIQIRRLDGTQVCSVWI